MTDSNWNLKNQARQQRLQRASRALGDSLQGKICSTDKASTLLEAVLQVGDRVCLEGNNQKQADFLAQALADLDPARVHDLHMVQSVLSLPSHLDVFEKGIANRLDFSFSGPQGARLARLASAGRLNIGAIHTYLELFARYFVDLTPNVALIAAQAADEHGNLYTGPNTEDTPAIVEATAFSGGIVIAQVNELVDSQTTRLPRVDIPADWVNFVVQAPKPEPHRTAVHPRSGTDLRDPGADGDDGHQGHLRRVRREPPQPWHRLRHRRHRAAAADLRRIARLEGKNLPALGVEPTPGADSGDRIGLRQVGAFVRLRTGHGEVHRRTKRCVLHRRRWLDALQPRVLADSRPVCLRHVHRFHPADRPAGQQLHCHPRPHRRLRWRTEHGLRCTWPPPCQRGLDQGRPRGSSRTPGRSRYAAWPQAGGADGGNLPRTHDPRFCGHPGCLDPARTDRHGSASHHGVWRRCHPHPD
uniref:Malonate decarboxylase subunit alpha n=1 Tax=Parastrongyloides trichosuri TaxID=131310 RepID=A0A0N4ZEE0_PARTI